MECMPHRKLRETKQQPSMLPGPAVPGCCLVSFHFLCNIHSIHSVQVGKSFVAASWESRLSRGIHLELQDFSPFPSIFHVDLIRMIKDWRKLPRSRLMSNDREPWEPNPLHVTRGIRNPGVRQCLCFCTVDFWSSLAYESAEQKPKHCLTPGFLIPLHVTNYSSSEMAKLVLQGSVV